MKRDLIVLLFFNILVISGQNTVGTISISNNAQEGYTLFTNHTETYLIDNCGRRINQWSSDFPPGNAVYLLENGNILRAGRTSSTDITFGGQGGVIEQFNWEGDLVWQFFYDTPQHRQHHDVYPMPNGNVLILAATVMSNAEAIQAGRDPNLLTQSVLYNERIIEVDPIGLSGGNIVWQWNINDHLIQDFDGDKDNFGNVALSPSKLDINFLNGRDGLANWLHINSIQYNEELDQIVLSSRNLSEIWIIDHSTTTAQAATGFGGNYGKGGDFLYRWGNPQAYRQGNETDRQLFGQHTPYFIPSGLNDEGKIILYNNGIDQDRDPLISEVNIISPPTTTPGVYEYSGNTAYGPSAPDYIYDGDSIIGTFFSAILSSAQRLPNGNTLICEGRSGEIFEIDENDNKVWEYISPVDNINGNIATQGEPINVQSLTFRAFKYAPNYAAFAGRDLTPGLPIEQNPNLDPCENLSVATSELTDLIVHPLPVKDHLYIETSSTIDAYEIFGILGNSINKSFLHTNFIDFSELNSGIYLLKLYSGNTNVTKKVVKE